MTHLELSSASVMFLLALNLFVWFERNGRPDRTTMAVLVTIVVDAILNPLGFATPTGLFKMPVGPFSLFLPEVIIAIALAARLVGRQSARWSAGMLWWAAFFFWLLGAAVKGILAGNAPNLVLFEAKALLYVGGSLILAAGGSIRDEGLWRLIRWTAPVAGLLVALDQTGVRLTADLPLVPLRGFGQLGADAATILGSLGLVGLLVARAQQRRLVDIAGALALAVVPTVSQQRAALIAWVISIAVVLLLASFRRSQRVPRIRRARVSLLMLGLGAAFILSASVRLVSEPARAVPLISQMQQSFATPAKQESWQSRRNQWAVTPGLISEHPWLGSGLGTTYWHFEVAQNQLIETDVTHNLAFDLVLRTGAIGLCLFVLAISLSVRNGLVVWCRTYDDTVAATSAALIAVVIGLLAKGMVESILEKYRVAVLLGLYLGALEMRAFSWGADLTNRASLGSRVRTGGEGDNGAS